MSNPTSVHLTDEQRAALKAIGKRDERSFSWLVRRAVDEFIERHTDKEEGGAGK